MERKVNHRQEHLASLLCFAFVYLFLLFLNAIFPTQSDDIGRQLEGIQRAVDSYMTWNGRFGELLLVTFGSYLSTTPYYAPINALCGTSLILLVFVNVFGRLPQRNRQDISCFSILVTFIIFDPTSCFGSVFYWAAGSFNYLWAWLFILAVITPVGLFWRGVEFSARQNAILTVLGIPIGIIAGWSSEFGIVIIALWAASIVLAGLKQRRLPGWYYSSLVALVLGWCILYACPGMRVRAQNFPDYHSITALLNLGPIGLIQRILNTFDRFSRYFYFESFCLVSLFLLLTFFLYKTPLITRRGLLLSIFTMLTCLLFLPRIFFVLSVIIISISIARGIRPKNVFASNLFFAMGGIFIAAFLFIGATIQVIEISKRAKMQFTFLNIGLIAISMMYCFEFFKKNRRITRLASAACLVLSLAFAIFVGAECLRMSQKWAAMERSIEEQKSQGIRALVIDSNTFTSRFWNYGDWGNPGENPHIWPNTTYANYYGVDSITAQ